MKRRRSKPSGRSKINCHESVDRISDLPDSVLGIILSFLPTKDSVSTSILSKRWKLVWTTVFNLDFCYKVWRGEEDERVDTRFVEFVNRVLLLSDTGPLNKFRLAWTPTCISWASHATSWISTAISRNVHELSLYIYKNDLEREYDYEYPPTEPFIIPVCVFSCNTLRFLELNGSILVSAAMEVCLPKLETLKLRKPYFRSEEAFENLIRGCPVLINLHIIDPRSVDDLYETTKVYDFTYVISSTSLKRLELIVDDTPDLPLVIDVVLEASSLEYLTLEGRYGLIPVFHRKKSLSSLVEVKFNLDLGTQTVSDARTCDSVVEAVRVFDCAKALTLSAHVIWALSCATITLSTGFKRLVKLEVETYCCANSSLRDLIECSDNLEVLIVKQDITGPDEDEHDHTYWTPPVQVPRCLSNSLKKFVVDGYYGAGDEHEMVCYMLNHGRALEVMEISCCKTPSEDAKLDLVQEICDFSTNSSSKFPDCEFKFAGETSKCSIKLL